ncbi:ABC transporter permease [Ectothiorhodospira lacustris]|uniref:ABC transporter permease n=1 Tax=Ectothiorhodospira lacustris TaxID=2899127 RepID=UPI001EE7A778|nr:MlaE family lipid ABC transporter permease subunit [Ectothiorhodospira lacustris]MCG5521717.1 MlaE family lipid ABC transporter permease subunit [Ectothiorhodospira lacustris]
MGKKTSVNEGGAQLNASVGPAGECILALSGRLDAYTVGGFWSRARRLLDDHPATPVRVDLTAVEYCDGAGVALLLDLLRQPRATAAEVALVNVPAKVSQLLEPFDAKALVEIPGSRRPPGLRQRLADSLHDLGRDLYLHMVFIGEAAAALAHGLTHPARVRWKDALRIAQEAGVNALPIVALIAFLMGVILAFQSAVAMKQFGAEIFVANLVALSLFRELGPLMTAILLAGRSASAFAAEIGTMKVNEELNALTTMGVDPVRFLVVTRVLAAVIIAPLLTIFADLVGLMGGAMVMMTFDVPFVAFMNQVSQAVSPGDFLGGLFKAAVFGLVIAGVGCLRGLETRAGASAVGISTTRAVVSAIILIVVLDGLFAVVFFHLGI